MGMTQTSSNQKSGHQDSGHQKPKSIRLIPVIAGLLFVILAALVFVISENQARQTNTGFPSFDQSEFTLIDQDGVTRTNSDFAGKPIALFLGFTYCPDVCPTTLLALAGAVDDLVERGIDASVIQTIFISVDHERDTPAQLKSYLSLFDVEATGLTGDAQAVSDAIRAFGGYAKKIETGDGNFVYDHSAAVYLYRSDGTFKGTIVFNEPAEFIVEKLKTLL